MRYKGAEPDAPTSGLRPLKPLRALVFAALAAGGALAQEKPATDVREQVVWHVLEAGDFEIHYSGEDLVPCAREAAAWLQAAQERMEREFDFSLRRPVRVILYRSRLQARQSELLQEAPGELGGLVAEAQKRRIIAPLVPSPKAMQRTLEHQLAHVMMEQAHFGRTAFARSILEYKQILYPAWVVEGIAESQSLAREPLGDMLVRDAVLDRDLPLLSALHGDDPLNPHEFAQLQAYSAYALRWIAARTPRGSIKRMFRVFDSDLPWPSARLVRRATGMSYNDVERGVRDTLRQEAAAWTQGREEAEAFSRRARTRRRYYRTWETGPVWSPDGRRIAFFQDEDNYFSLTVLDLESGSESHPLSLLIRVTIDSVKAQDRGLDWSPDGQTLLFVGDRLGRPYLYFKPLDGAGFRRVALPFDDVSQPQYSPDGRTVVFSGQRSGRSDLYLLDVATLEVRRLTRHDWPESDPAWSPDGRRIAYAGETDGQFDLYLIDLETRAVERLTSTPADEISPAFTPDGRGVTFATDAGGAHNLATLDLAARTLTRHTDVPGGAFSPRWQPGGTQLLFTNYRHGRFAAHLMPPRNLPDAPAPDLTPRAEQNRRWFLGRAADYHIREYEARIEFESILPTSAQLADLFQHHEIDTAMDYKLRSGGYLLGGEITYRNRSLRPDIQLSVAGATERTSDASEHSYGAEAGISYPLDRFTRAGAEYFISRRSRRFRASDPDDTTAAADSDELQAGFRFSVSRRSIVKRRRDPISGYSVSLSVETLLPEVGSDLSRMNYSGEGRLYLEVWEDHVLAGRLRFIKTNGHDADDISLKGLVRGYGSRRPVGTDAWAATIEYRFPLWRDLNWALPGQLAMVKDLRAFVFFDIAVLSAEENLLNELVYPVRDEWHHAAGFGVRLDTYLLEKRFLPVILTVSKATDGTEDAYSGVKFELSFDLEF